MAATIYHAEARIEFGSGMQYAWYENGRRYLTSYAYLGPPSHKINQMWHPTDTCLHCFFQCEEPYIPDVVAAQLMERLLRGCLLFSNMTFRVRCTTPIALQEVSKSEHPFLVVGTNLFPLEPQEFSLQPECEGTARLVGSGSILANGHPMVDIGDNRQNRIMALVCSYQDLSVRTRRIIEFYLRGSLLLDQPFYEEAFLNFYKVYESFRHLLRRRFPLEDKKLHRIASKADQQKERANTIAQLVGLSISHNDDFQEKLDKLELYRDQIAAHWNFREHDDGWSLPFSAVAVADFLSHRIVLWEIAQELGDFLEDDKGNGFDWPKMDDSE